MARQKIAGIYSITSAESQRIYIGQSKDIYARFWEHNYLLLKGKHTNNHLQHTYSAYGKDDLFYDVVEVVTDVNYLDDKERYYISFYQNIGIPLFNTKLDCITGRGMKWTDEQRDRLSTQRNGGKTYVLISPQGVRHEFTNRARFAEQQGLFNESVYNVLKGEVRQVGGWRLPENDLPPPKSYKLTEAQRRDICERYNAGESSVKIAKDFSLSSNAVRSLLRKRGVTIRGRNGQPL